MRERVIPCEAIGSYDIVLLSKWIRVVDMVSRNEVHSSFDHGLLILGMLGVRLEIVGTILVVVVEHLDFLTLWGYIIIW